MLALIRRRLFGLTLSPQRLLTAALWALGFVVSFPRLMEIPGTGLDGSWGIGLNHAVADGRVFGRDVIFTYGPLCFFLHPLDVGSNLVVGAVFHVALHAVWWAVLGWIMFRIEGVWLPALIILGPVTTGLPGDEVCWRWMVAVVGLLIIADQTARILPILLAAGLAALALLAKINIGVAAIAAIAVAALYDLRRAARARHSRSEGVSSTPPAATRPAAGSLLVRHALAVLAGVTTFLVAFRIWGGPLAAVPDFLRLSFIETAGYSSQMSLVGPSLDLWLAAAQVAVAIAALWFGRPWKPVLTTLLLVSAPCLLVAWKSGFVRHDGHAHHFFMAMTLFSALPCLAAIGRRGRIAMTCLVLPLVVSSAAWRISMWPTASITPQGWEYLRGLAQWKDYREALGRLARTPERQQTLPNRWLQRIGDRTIDAYPWDISVLTANRLNWRPRLALQSYNAYDPRLDEPSAAAYRADDAPRFIFYQHLAIDQGFPQLTDPLTYLELLRWYELVDIGERGLLLERRPTPRLGEPVAGPAFSISLSRAFEVPHRPGCLSLLRADMRLVFAGQVLDKVWKVLPPNMTLRLDEGLSATRRIVWRNLPSGMIVSHLPSTYPEWVLFLRGQDMRPVRTVSIEADPRAFASRFDGAWMFVPFIDSSDFRPSAPAE